MKLGNRVLLVIGCVIVLAASAATTYAAADLQVPEMDSASLLIVGLGVGGFLVTLSKFRRK